MKTKRHWAGSLRTGFPGGPAGRKAGRGHDCIRRKARRRAMLEIHATWFIRSRAVCASAYSLGIQASPQNR